MNEHEYWFRHQLGSAITRMNEKDKVSDTQQILETQYIREQDVDKYLKLLGKSKSETANTENTTEGQKDNWAQSYAQFYKTQKFEKTITIKKEQRLRLATFGVTVTVLFILLAGMILICKQNVFQKIMFNEVDPGSVDVDDLANDAGNQNITVEKIQDLLQQMGPTAETETVITGSVEYSCGSIPYITQGSYTMSYSAIVTIGIDLENLSVSIAAQQIIITIPKPEVQNVEIDKNSIAYEISSAPLIGTLESYCCEDENTLKDAAEDACRQIDVDEIASNLTTSVDNNIITLLDSIGQYTLIIVQS